MILEMGFEIKQDQMGRMLAQCMQRPGIDTWQGCVDKPQLAATCHDRPVEPSRLIAFMRELSNYTPSSEALCLFNELQLDPETFVGSRAKRERFAVFQVVPDGSRPASQWKELTLPYECPPTMGP